MKTFKKTLIVVLLFFFAISVGAQTDAGKFLIGGMSNLSLTSSTDKWKDDEDSGTDGNTISLSLTPQGGYFVIDNLAIGAGLQLQYSRYKPDDDDEVEKSSQTMGIFQPFIRYYFGSTKIKPFVQTAVGIGSAKAKYTYYDPWEDKDVTETDRARIILFDIGGGVGIFLNEMVSIDLRASYSWMSMKPSEDNDSNYRSILSSIGMGAGITILL